MTISVENLPSLSQAYALGDDQITRFRRDGHILLPRVCSPEEVAIYGPLIAEAVALRTLDLGPMDQRDTYGKAFIQIMNLWREEERLKRFVFATRFAKIAAALLEVASVRLYHDQALFKEGRGGLTPWHQDQHYWPLDTDNTVTMWMPLVDVLKEMGTMSFASGSQAAGYLGDLPISDESDAQLEAFVSERGYEVRNYGAMNAGDATFHSGWVLHGAPPNDTDDTREVMTVIYYPDGTRILEPDNENRQCDLDTWIPGGVPGEPAASELNPIVYPGS